MLLLFFLIIGLYFLITALIALILNPTTKPVIPIGIPTKRAKAKIEIHPVKLKYRSIQYNLNTNLFMLLAHQFILL